MKGGAHGAGRYLLVTWQAGGGTMPMLGLGRLLAASGHDVRLLGPTAHRERAERAGCRFRPSRVEFDPTGGRALEDQEAFVILAVTGMPIAEAVLAEVEEEPPDAIVVDHQLWSGTAAAERTGLPTASLLHTSYAYHGFAEPEAWARGLEPVNQTRAALGLAPLELQGERVTPTLYERCDLALVPMPAEFDDARERTPANLRHVGPLFEEDPATATWDRPWPEDDDRPFVVISLSSQYMHQEDLLRRVFEAVDGAPFRVLVLTGNELEPHEVEAPDGVVVERYVPHVAVLPGADLVVTHAGMGTVMAALGAGVPLVCLPLGRDQPMNAAKVAVLGAGVAMDPEPAPSDIRGAIDHVLASRDLRAGAGRMAEVVAGYRDGAQAVEALEQLLA